MTHWHGETCSLSELKLGQSEIHIWRVALTSGIWAVKLRGLLSDDECQRADRFLMARDRQRFTIARGALRILLSHYLSVPATEISFRYGEYGKPILVGSVAVSDTAQHNQLAQPEQLANNDQLVTDGNLNTPYFSIPATTSNSAVVSLAAEREIPSIPLHFNLSHSQDLAVYGFCQTTALGIDIEMMRPMRDIDQIAQRFFSPQEAAVVHHLSGLAKQQGFFNCWTRKEAFIKAIGKGVFFGLDRFAVSLIPGENPAILWIADDPHGPCAWQLRSFSPAPDYLAALAFPAGDYQLRFYDGTARLVELL